jgi:hypothetical protein
MSSTIECKDCENNNIWDTSCFFAPPELAFVIEKKPIITCGRCGAQNIKVSDHQFFSFNMEVNDSESDYVPESTEHTWTLQDNRQRLPDVIWLNSSDFLGFMQSGEAKVDGVYFKDFDNFEKERYSGNKPLYPFKRVKHIDDIHDLYLCVCEDKRDLKYVVRYYDRMEKGETRLNCRDFNKSAIEGIFDLGDVDGLEPYKHVPPKNSNSGFFPSQSDIDRIVEEAYGKED